MIISASRRTDIPAFYADWFFNRLREGYALVRHPMNPHIVSRVALTPDVVDGIVFWTKNPLPMLSRLDALRDYAYYFQFTLTPYGPDVEKSIPSKNDVIIPTFQKLSGLLGRERVVWRYDPILLSDTYTMAYHKKYFALLCSRLADYTETCTISFLDLYRSIHRTITPLGIHAPTGAQAEELAGYFSETAKEYGMDIDTCAEEIDLGKYRIGHGACIDPRRLERIGGYQLDIPRDKNQRAACGCAAAVDLGAYNTCGNGCVYCYANFNQTLVDRHHRQYDPASPLLCDRVLAGDTIKTRSVRAHRDGQLPFIIE